jgi:hypothetical protein
MKGARVVPDMLARNAVAVLLLAASALSSGCSARFAYEHLDKMIVWSVDDYFTFDAEQKRYLEAGVDSFMYWHRTQELPVYASTLRRFAGEVRDGLTGEPRDRCRASTRDRDSVFHDTGAAR